MVGNVLSTLLRGSLAVIPAVVTVAFLWWIISSAERFIRSLITATLGEGFYLPGTGILLALGVTFVAGIFMKSKIVQAIYAGFENIFHSLPLVKTVYGSLKEFLEFFIKDKEEFSKAVLVSLDPEDDDSPKLLGFVTSQEPEKVIGDDLSNQVAVYFPMSYQLGGYTVFVKKDRIRQTDLSTEDALQYVLTAGVGKDKGASG